MGSTKKEHPGSILMGMLDEQGFSQRELASIIQVAHSHLNQILQEERGISADVAIRLKAAGFKTAVFWMEKQMLYDLDKKNSELSSESKDIKIWSEIQNYIPVNYFRKKGVLTSSLNEDINTMLKIYNVNNVSLFVKKIDNYNFTHFRKSSAFTETRNNVIAWSCLAEYNAAKLDKVRVFDPENKSALIQKLRKLFVENNNIIENIKNLLKDFGIKFFILDRPPKTPVDGKSFMSGENPAIVLSLKYKRLDNFAYTLMHELGHVYNHLTKAKFKSESFFTNNTKNDILEFEADSFARNELISLDEWNQFIESNDVFSDDVIIDFAEEINIHPAIIRGRVCYEYNNYYRRASNITTTNKIN